MSSFPPFQDLKPVLAKTLFTGIIVLAMVFSFFFVSAANPILGRVDFVVYYSALRLFSEGVNPYNIQAVEELQRQLMGSDGIPVPFFYSPILLVFFAFLVPFSLSGAASIWFALCVLMSALIGYFTGSALSASRPLRRASLLAAIAASSFYFPHAITISYGQLGIFIGCAISAFLLFWNRKQDILAGICLLAPAIKPQSYFLLGLLIFLVILRERRWKVLASFVIAYATLLLCSEFVVPGIVSEWLHIAPAVSEHLSRVESTTLSGVLQSLTSHSGVKPIWPCVVVPLLGTALGVSLYFRYGQTKNLGKRHLHELLPYALCMTLFFAPYGWFHDQSSLAIVQCLLALKCFDQTTSIKARNAVILAIAGFQLLIVSFKVMGFDNGHDFFWLPVAMLLLWHGGSVYLSKSSSGLTSGP